MPRPSCLHKWNFSSGSDMFSRTNWTKLFTNNTWQLSSKHFNIVLHDSWGLKQPCSTHLSGNITLTIDWSYCCVELLEFLIDSVNNGASDNFWLLLQYNILNNILIWYTYTWFFKSCCISSTSLTVTSKKLSLTSEFPC